MNEISDNALGLVRSWYSSQDELRRAKKYESELRSEVIDALLEEKVSGTKNFDLPNNMELKISIPRNISIDEEKLKDKLSLLKSRGLVGEKKLVSLKPKASLTAWNFLSDEDKEMFSDLFIFKSGTPSIEVKSKK